MADDTLQTAGTPGGLSAPTVEPPKTEPDTPKTSPETPPPAKPGRRKKQKGFIRRHKILIAIAVLLAIVASSAGGYWWWLNHQLSDIQRFNAGISVPPGKNGSGEQNKPLDILLLGADNGADKLTVADELKAGTWTPFAHRSDTIMIAHIPADRSSVQLVSIPRDSWVPIPGYPSSDHYAKINAAFAYGGPQLAIRTVQDLTGIHIDHVAIIDWAGFRELTTALGGVRIYIPETFYDSSQKITWEKGWQTLEGDRALQYVRTRHDIPGEVRDDWGRMARQQNFLRAVMAKLLASSTTHNPLRFSKVLASLSSYLTLDSSWDNDEIRSLAWSLRNLNAEDVSFFTAPLGRYDTVDDQSVVRLDMTRFRVLIRTIKNDRVDRYVAKYPDDRLAGSTHVN